MGRTVVFPVSWAPLASVDYRNLDHTAFPMCRPFAFRTAVCDSKENEYRCQNRPVVIVDGFDQIIPLSPCQESQKNPCGSSGDE
ncbi:MAG: hypothetical protein EA424_29400 [Planctomycetaceae bacterium]|nr:MAG: hypothetical protein EA424_29400 [Planctomycetaceae bacterium]